ncbi:hypothetical protein HK103_006704 [Boothiomyces macroporosus]|uniref:N-acetyltransferase domain-containing protein n=1 Tax=Boothiomyces macroporosus TaxID=261099 RepID=A0AAD5UDD8_9FUNG|nr:hypothetical protein HK103_006704 [Boothiomyces macroporosus]
MKVHSLQEGQEDIAVEILLNSFHSDPIAKWIFSDDTERDENYYHIFTEAVVNAKIVDIVEDKSAVCLWSRIEGGVSEPTNFKYSTEAQKLFSIIDKHAPSTPYWYLSWIGSLNEGNGAGTALLNYRLPQLEGPVALWTGNEKNLKFYEKFGFQVSAKCSYNGANAWWMVRELK